MAYPRRFPAPWKVEERDECFIVVDGSGQKLAHLYFEDEPIRQGILKRLGKDDAWRIARAITPDPGAVAPGLSAAEPRRCDGRSNSLR